MGAKTLYDILEVSPSASPEAIRAAYERLSAKYDPYTGENRSADTRLRHDAVKEAFLTLGAPEKRARYDRERMAKLKIEPPPFSPAPTSAWGSATFVILLLLLIGGGLLYYQKQQEVKRIAAEQALAEAKAREAAERARLLAEQRRAESDRVRLELQQQRTVQQNEDRLRREHEASLRRLTTEQRYQTQSQTQSTDHAARRAMQEERRAEDQRRREEQQAAAAAAAQVAREKAELCRIERERYGRAISC